MAHVRSAPPSLYRLAQTHKKKKATVAVSDLPIINSEEQINRLSTRRPKRYEETRTALLQDIAHNRIIHVGNDIESRICNEHERVKEEEITKVEMEVWLKAEQVKLTALEHQRLALLERKEKEKNNMRKEFNTTLQETIHEIESEMERLKLEALAIERQEGATRLAEAVDQVNNKWQNEVKNLISDAREEERLIAQKKIEDLKTQQNRAIIQLNEELQADKEAALCRLQNEMEYEREIAVVQTRRDEQQNANNLLHAQRIQYDKEIAVMQNRLSAKCLEMDTMILNMARLNAEKSRVEDELVMFYKHFSDFVHLVLNADKGQAEYLLPLTKLLNEIRDKTNHPFFSLSQSALIQEETPVEEEALFEDVRSSHLLQNNVSPDIHQGMFSEEFV